LESLGIKEIVVDYSIEGNRQEEEVVIRSFKAQIPTTTGFDLPSTATSNYNKGHPHPS